MKKEIIILLVIIVALSGYLVMKKTDRTNYELPMLEEIAAGDVDRMEIKERGKTLLLEKSDGNWAVDIEGFPGKKEEADTLVKVASELSLTALASEAKSYARYNLDTENAKEIALYKGETLLRKFAIGKAAPTGQHTFVTVGTDENVYQAKGSLTGQFTAEPGKFIDKKVFGFSVDEINGVSVTRGDKTIAAKRSSAPAADITPEASPAAQIMWVDATGKTIEKSQIDNLLATLSSLSCDNWLVPGEANENPAATLTIVTDRPYTLTLFKNTEEETVATASGKEFPFALAQATVNNLTSSMEAFMGETKQTDEVAKQ